MSQESFFTALAELSYDDLTTSATTANSLEFGEDYVMDLALRWDDVMEGIEPSEEASTSEPVSLNISKSPVQKDVNRKPALKRKAQENDDTLTVKVPNSTAPPAEPSTSRDIEPNAHNPVNLGSFRPKGSCQGESLKKSKKGKGKGKKSRPVSPPRQQPITDATDAPHVQRGEGGEGGDDCDGNFKVTTIKSKYVKKFNTSETIHVVKLTPKTGNRTWRSNMDLLTRSIQYVLDQSTLDLHDDDLVRVYINQRGLETPLVLSLRRKGSVTVDAILEIIERILQSHESIFLNDTFEIHIGTIRIVRGGKGKAIVNLDKDKTNKKSIIQIKNKDNTCLARALVVGEKYVTDDPEKRKIAFKNMALQTHLALDLCKKAGVDPTEPCGLQHIPAFEKVLNIQVVVISANELNDVIYKGSIETEVKIFVLYHNNHFDVITSMAGYFGSSYYCTSCFKRYNNISDHRCGNQCTMCYTKGCEYTDPVNCLRCNRIFHNRDCYARHSIRKPHIIQTDVFYPSICDKIWLCVRCNRLITRAKRSQEDHQCEEVFCTLCRVYHLGDHKCYMKPGSSKKPSCLYIFFDFETNQETGEHIPNFCVAHKVCDKCINLEDVSECEKCDLKEMVFQGTSTLKCFGEWLFSDQHKGYTAIAHNGKAFDFVFVLRYIVDQTITPEIIYSGGKIMYLYIQRLNIRLIDSLNLIPRRLADFPKTFNIPMKKGWFPHLFNTSENQDYVGSIPGIEYYGVDDMSVEDKKDFLEWHSVLEKSGYVFDFKKEMEVYCRADVEILKRCCLKFRDLIMGITTLPNDPTSQGIDPLRFITIASLCFDIFKHKFLKPETIALVPANGILGKDQFSGISIQWMDWIMFRSKQEGPELQIEHALNKGEHRLGRFKCDGYDRSSDTVYEFYGCWYHGCQTCYDADTIHPPSGKSMGELYQRTVERETILKGMCGGRLFCIWEHDFRKQIESNEELRDFISKSEVHSRLDPRDAFFGGRTGATKMLYIAEEGTSINYVDFTSLYPSVNKYSEYCLKYPTIITRDFGDITRYTGFIKCKVLPPRGLYLPVLPYRSNNRLMFPLCRTCCDSLTQSECRHTDDERALAGTWVTNELCKSLTKGYRVLNVYEVYHFEETAQYDGRNEDSGLFTGYINTFLKLKQESSGWPDWVKSDEDKHKYVQLYEENEGIKLDSDNIVKNPGLRSVAKLCLNTVWGKFGQRNGLPQASFISNQELFNEFLNDPTKDITDFHTIHEGTILLEWKAKQDFVPTGHSSNPWVAAMTTAHARLKLYEVLEQLDRRVLYYDTDSVIYFTEPGQLDVPTGDYLGQLTSELDEGDTIIEFASGGPKNYAYKTKLGKTVTKVRGFTLNAKNSEVINFQTVSEMVQNVLSDCPCSDQPTRCERCVRSVYKDNKITRRKVEMKIVNRPEKKDYRVHFVKRVILPDLDTLPYGF